MGSVAPLCWLTWAPAPGSTVHRTSHEHLSFVQIPQDTLPGKAGLGSSGQCLACAEPCLRTAFRGLWALDSVPPLPTAWWHAQGFKGSELAGST
jgi:hypothetical protein